MARGRFFSKATHIAVLGTAVATMVVATGAPAGAATTANLIKNGNAESALKNGNIPNWTRSTGTTLTEAKYGSATGFPTKNSPGPSNRGKNFFVGGKDPDFMNEVAIQSVSLSKYLTKIKGGHAKATMSGFFGGFANQDDNAGVELDFKDANGLFVGTGTSIGFLNAADRHNVTGLFKRSSTISVPKGARSVYLQLIVDNVSGDFNNGYADNLSLTLSGV